MLLFTFDKDIQPGDRIPFRFRRTPATTPIPAHSAPANLGHPSKPDDAASVVDAILHGAELTR